MNFRMYLITILSIATALNAMEMPLQAPIITLASSDGKEFKVPLEIAQQSELIKSAPDLKFWYFDTIFGQELAEIIQLMQMLYQHKNLNEKQFFEKVEKEIPIRNNFSFLMAVKTLEFGPGIALISKKYAERGDHSFPNNEYEYYMKRIQELNPHAYEKLKKCESANGKPCIKIAIAEDSLPIEQGSAKTNGYPILLINPITKLMDQELSKKALEIYIEAYNNAPIISEITPDEQKYILEIIKDLAPSLYKEIVAVDPTGADHIKRNDTLGSKNIAVTLSLKDGLPMIYLGSEASKIGKEQLRFSIAHELGHYVLGHFKEPTLTHAVLQKVAAQEFKKGKKVRGQLPFKESFKYAFTRTQEFEADRFAILEFGINIDDAIATAKRWISEFEEHKLESPEKEGFKSTHPLGATRIKQLEELRREVELRKAQKRQLRPINWKELAVQYLKEYHP